MNFKSIDQLDFTVNDSSNKLAILWDGVDYNFNLNTEDQTLFISADNLEHESLMLAVEYIFNNRSSVKRIILDGNERKEFSRQSFYQNQGLWNLASHQVEAEVWTTGERPHPKRNDRKNGLFYHRYSSIIDKVVSLRGIDPNDDLEIFHRWQNQTRVSYFWELNQSKEELHEYIIKTQNDPHMIPVIVELSGRPVGYFEFYWTLEDRLGPYYEADPFDRGFHFLIGEKEALGYENTNAIVRSALHFLFLDDPRTRRVMAEPRHDNFKVLRYAETSGWKKLKEFDFPHKRAALLECKRENFFNGEYL